MKKTGLKGFTILMIFLMLAGLGYYTYLNQNNAKKQENSEESEVSRLLNYDFEEDYPKTVREVVKLHCKYLKNAYNGKFTEEELFTINKQIRQLFDEELLENNPQEKQLQGLKDDIALYSEENKKYISYTLAEASQIDYNTENDKEYAKITVSIVLKADTLTLSGEEEYILRKDTDGRWKILGWQAVQQETTQEDEGEIE